MVVEPAIFLIDNHIEACSSRHNRGPIQGPPEAPRCHIALVYGMNRANPHTEKSY